MICLKSFYLHLNKFFANLTDAQSPFNTYGYLILLIRISRSFQQLIFKCPQPGYLINVISPFLVVLVPSKKIAVSV